MGRIGFCKLIDLKLDYDCLMNENVKALQDCFHNVDCGKWWIVQIEISRTQLLMITDLGLLTIFYSPATIKSHFNTKN